MYGIKYLHTKPYHPQANGLVERLHRQLKLALLCHKKSLYDALPAVLLGLRAAWKDNMQTTQAESVYGEPIRSPALAEMSRHGKHFVFCFRSLSTCSHVLVRNDQIGPSFSAPYEGPYRVITRHNKYFIVDFRERQIVIAIDRLKPVYEANSVDTATITTNSQPDNTATETRKR
ncbi:uncharacterized protein LOC128668522 [Microplitis demolitor]|uniref:uncharacterized protein LOC128668521 n=1 Tax=Microplitis demolitor TaxID=69319 RepID=UPI0004CDBDDC|nr:uncharacterized protein LOC128668521 [Microplitis demolitor]XP_053597649.1 uncharacterized protein LOC128668522 [Microplitis demolitor]